MNATIKCLINFIFLLVCGLIVVGTETNYSWVRPMPVGYADMWFHNDTGLSSSIPATYVNITVFDNSTSGHSYLDGFNYSVGGKLVAKSSGIYQVTYLASGKGTNNHEYHLGIAINGVMQYNTNNHVIGGVNDQVLMPGGGFITVVPDDVITLQIKDALTSVGTIYIANVNLVKIK